MNNQLKIQFYKLYNNPSMQMVPIFQLNESRYERE
jgi:hypothetical protein